MLCKDNKINLLLVNWMMDTCIVQTSKVLTIALTQHNVKCHINDLDQY